MLKSMKKMEQMAEGLESCYLSKISELFLLSKSISGKSKEILKSKIKNLLEELEAQCPETAKRNDKEV